jgi:hypothetical protein
MKPTIFAPFAAALLGGAAALLAVRPAAATPPPPPPPAVEHKVLVVDFEEFKALDEYKALEKETGSPWLAQFAFQERVLNRAGAEGWELEQVYVPKSPAQSVFYLKRAAGR